LLTFINVMSSLARTQPPTLREEYSIAVWRLYAPTPNKPVGREQSAAAQAEHCRRAEFLCLFRCL
jgi:hypothetical protein